MTLNPRSLPLVLWLLQLPMAVAGIPGIVGATDGTHIRDVAQKEYEEVYVNRKKYHALRCLQEEL